MKKVFILLLFIFIVDIQLNAQKIESLSNKRIISEVIINGIKGNALIDTGSTVSIIDIDKSKKFGFVVGSKYAFDLITIKGDDINIYCPLKIDARLFDKMIYPILTTEIENVRRSIKKDTGIEIDMIIGLKSVKNIGISISIDNDKIYISKNS